MPDGYQTAFNVAGSVVGLVSVIYIFIFKMIFVRIKEMSDGISAQIKDLSETKCDSAVCTEKHDRINADLRRGEDKFKDLCRKLDEATESLIENNKLLALATQRLTALDGGGLPARRKDDKNG